MIPLGSVSKIDSCYADTNLLIHMAIIFGVDQRSVTDPLKTLSHIHESVTRKRGDTEKNVKFPLNQGFASLSPCIPLSRL